MSKTNEQHTFKRTTVDNWLQPDPLMAVLVKRDRRDGSVLPVDPADWVRYADRLRLPATVPVEVRDAFEFALGAVGYGYFYYPIFTLVSQQVLRVADFAVDKFLEANQMKKPRAFAARLKVLNDAGVLGDADAHRWEGIRRLRNSATHPSWQENWGFPSLDTVRMIAEAIASLPWPQQSPTEGTVDDIG